MVQINSSLEIFVLVILQFTLSLTVLFIPKLGIRQSLLTSFGELTMPSIIPHERGREVVEKLFQTIQEVAQLLEIPAGSEVWKAGNDASRDGIAALRSTFNFVVLVGRPFVLGAGWILFLVGRAIWEQILVKGIYEHGLSQTRQAAILFWKFQRGLSREGLIVEAVICVVLVALYLLRRWLQRNQYIQRARVVVRRQFRRASQVSSFVLEMSCLY